MPLIHPFMAIIGLASLAVAASYAVLTLVAALVWQIRRASTHLLRLPPVTVLKPLCGAEPGLYEHLRSFCRQDYSEFQIVFGVRDLAGVNSVILAGNARPGFILAWTVIRSPGAM